MNRIGIVAGLGLALSACACGPSADHAVAPPSPAASVSAPRHVSAGGISFARGTAEQAVGLPWIRTGVWKPVRMETVGRRPSAAMIDVDATGARIVALNGDAGYDLYRIDLHCGRANYAVTGARRSRRDDRPPTGKVQITRSRVAPPEIRRVCSQPSTAGLKGSVYQAVAALRSAGPLPQEGMRAMPAPPSAAERARAWQAYKDANGM